MSTDTRPNGFNVLLLKHIAKTILSLEERGIFFTLEQSTLIKNAIMEGVQTFIAGAYDQKEIDDIMNGIRRAIMFGQSTDITYEAIRSAIVDYAAKCTLNFQAQIDAPKFEDVKETLPPVQLLPRGLTTTTTTTKGVSELVVVLESFGDTSMYALLPTITMLQRNG